ncbi:hypothetical protein HY469_03070 [Candidatus Roizmanbacteria bacterium]|nr:hypothetical protein [Candidatus Roizmanbacteria bacterium]
MKNEKLVITIICSLFVLVVAGTLVVGYYSSKPLGATLTEVPNEVRTQIGTKYYHSFQNNDTKEIVEVETSETEYSALSKKGAGRVGKPGYTWLGSKGGIPVYATSVPILLDNQFYRTGKTDIGSTTPEVKVKLPGKEPETKYEKDLYSVKFNPFFNTAFAASPVLEASTTGSAGSVTSLIYPVVVPSGLSNSLMVTFVITNAPVGSDTSTKFDSVELTAGGGNLTTDNKKKYWSYQVNPTATTTANMYVDIGPTAAGIIQSATAIISGANQTTPVSASTTKTETGDISVQFDTVLDELLLDWTAYESTEAFSAFGAGQTQAFIKDSGSGQNDAIGSKKIATSTAQTTMYTNITGADNSHTIAISISEPAAPVAASPDFESDLELFGF